MGYSYDPCDRETIARQDRIFITHILRWFINKNDDMCLRNLQLNLEFT